MVTSPDKLMFPGHTKREMVAYYQAFAGWMLPHMIDRPVTLERYPNGVMSKGFMQKNAGSHFPDFIGRHEVPKRDGVTVYPVVTTSKGVAYLANQGTVTFHLPTARIGAGPDRMIFDLDPVESDVVGVRRAAGVIRALLEELGYTCLIMTTGSKGYHVVSPLHASVGYDVIAPLAHSVAAVAANRLPDVMTLEFLKKERKGRVFVDWLRNNDGSTAVAPYSLRPRDEATIAMPIAWDEVDTTEPGHWTLASAAQRGHDAWEDFDDARVDPLVGVDAIRAMVADEGVVVEAHDRFGRK